jgi:hypothetical protein
MYFGDIPSAMLTLFNICILAEWGEIIRPVSLKQPLIVLFIFIPYLMLCTFGVLNLIIGVIAEQTLANGQELKDAEERERLRDKMKAIIHMTDEIYENDADGKLSKQEFMAAAHAHPDFVSTMRRCNFPRGFEVKDLHCIFDDTAEGSIDKDEFINGMFRLVFNDLSQHACTILLGLSQVKRELHDKVEEELQKIYSLIDDRFPTALPVVDASKQRLDLADSDSKQDMSEKQSELVLITEGLRSEQKKVEHPPMQPDISLQDDVKRIIAHIEDRMNKFAAAFEQKAPESSQVSTMSARLDQPEFDKMTVTAELSTLGERLLSSQQQFKDEVTKAMASLKTDVQALRCIPLAQEANLGDSSFSASPCALQRATMPIAQATTITLGQGDAVGPRSYETPRQAGVCCTGRGYFTGHACC